MNQLKLNIIDRVTGGKIGTFDVACPLCGPIRRSPLNQRRKVLRVWRVEPGFASFHCARCGEGGHTRDPQARTPDPAALAQAKAEAAKRERIAALDRLGKARRLWSMSVPIISTIAETYLRSVRGCGGPLPATLRSLRGGGKHSPAMIAAFGISHEPELALLAIAKEAVTGVHITQLKSDGSGKADTEPCKIMLGPSIGYPIVLAPPNDLLGLAICEGIEDALSIHEATGLGVWAAGSASRLPALAKAVPEYIDCVTILADNDADGRRHASALADLLRGRRLNVRLLVPGAHRRAA